MRRTVVTTRARMLLAKQQRTLHVWKKGLSILTITAEQAIKNYRARITKRHARVAPAPAVYQTFEIAQNAPAKLMASIRVPKRWLARKNINADQLKFGKLTNHAWRTLPLTKTGEDRRSVHYRVEITGEGLYSIYGKPAPAKARTVTSRIVMGIAALAIIVAAALVFSPSEQAQGVIPPQIWSENTVHRLYLGEYFNDPDKDTLIYSATATPHIKIDFIGNTAILTPNDGFTGEEFTRFSASDGKGGSTTSNTVALRVRRVVIPSSIQPAFAIFLALLAIVSLIFTVIRLKKK